MVTWSSVISSDGGEYATMAENLLHHRGLVGTYEGPEILYAPLYPILIGATMLVIPNSETAAHVVSLVVGTALIAFVFFVAERVYGRRMAYISALLVAIHPLLIALSASVYNEAVYLTMLMAIAYWALRALELERLRDSAVLGICIGLAYLTRVEATAYVPLAVAALLLVGVLRKRVRTAGLHAAIVCTFFLALAAPYIAFFYRHTGHVRLEAKWDINYTMARNRIEGMSNTEAAWGLGRDLSIEGPLLAPFEFADFTPYPHARMTELRSLISMANLNVRTVYHSLLEHQFGSPLLLGLLIIGWCRQSWTNRRLRDEAVLFALAGSIVAVTVTSATAEERYLFPILPFLMLWASNGLQQLTAWIMGWELMAGHRALRSARMALAVQLLTLMVMVGLELDGVNQDWYFASEHGPEATASREAGLWLAQYQPGSKRIAVRTAVVPYYAKGTLTAFPYGDPGATLQHFARMRVDFIVLESAEARVLPTIKEWMASGIPDPRAQRVYDKTNSNGARVVIYRWTQT
jgi:4-amino-4-deoxy-L-arabinose transferase-like glycosyltransferase